MDEVNGHKVGWALGAILYEINELPWILKLSPVEKHPLGFAILAGVLGKYEIPPIAVHLAFLTIINSIWFNVGFFIGAVAALFIYREMIENKRPRSESSHDDLKRLDALEDLRKRLSGGGGNSAFASRDDYGGSSGLQLSTGKRSPVNREKRDWVHSTWGSQKSFNHNVYDRIPETPDESI